MKKKKQKKNNGFDNNWDKTYKKKFHLSVWPWSDLISYSARYLKPKNKFKKILELGCGAGANIPFFLQRKFDYYGIEGSKTIIKKIKNKNKNKKLSKNIVCCDFTKEIPFDFLFDAVFDRASLTHNSTQSIEACLKILEHKIRKDGLFVGIDWFSTKHEDFKKGITIDSNTKHNIKSRQFKNLGRVHFSNLSHIKKIFSKFHFSIEIFEHKENKMLIGKNRINTSSINFIARKN
tara:strand:- start:3853 stop:4554 length:702 start_codon:yes stop_codon:yes gene_type:complete